MKTLTICALAVTVALSVAACGDKVADYNARMRTVADTILSNAALCEMVASEYRQTWSDAIDSHYKDFNEELAKKKTELAGVLIKLDKGKSWIDSSMRTLNDDIPDKAVEGHRKLMDFYGKYTQYYSQAESPSGSLISYSQNTNELSSELVKASNEMKVMNLLTVEGAASDK